MKKLSILQKSLICGLVYMVFSLLIILFVYIIGIFESAIALGLFYGIILAAVTSCEDAKRTIIARLMGIISAIAAQVILFFTGVPYEIILYIYRFRNNTWVLETGRLSVNEVIGYNWGTMFFWYRLLISFAFSVVGIFIFKLIKNRKKKEEKKSKTDREQLAKDIVDLNKRFDALKAKPTKEDAVRQIALNNPEKVAAALKKLMNDGN